MIAILCRPNASSASVRIGNWPKDVLKRSETIAVSNAWDEEGEEVETNEIEILTDPVGAKHCMKIFEIANALDEDGRAIAFPYEAPVPSDKMTSPSAFESGKSIEAYLETVPRAEFARLVVAMQYLTGNKDIHKYLARFLVRPIMNSTSERIRDRFSVEGLARPPTPPPAKNPKRRRKTQRREELEEIDIFEDEDDHGDWIGD